jgi:hypothetical protein
MTQITADISRLPETNTLHPSGILMALITALLAPMFLGVAAGDIGLARMAAAETINAYRARDHADLIAIAQIVACGLAALGSLSLSMEDDISLSMTLRLRGNANALNRSAEQNRRAMKNGHVNDLPRPQVAPRPEPEAPPTIPEDNDIFEPETLLSMAAEQELAAEAQARLQAPGQTTNRVPVPPPAPVGIPAAVSAISEKRPQAMEAITMVKESGEIAAGIPNLPLGERRAASMRAAALSSTAHDLLYGAPAAPLSSGALAGISRPDLKPQQRRGRNGVPVTSPAASPPPTDPRSAGWYLPAPTAGWARR